MLLPSGSPSVLLSESSEPTLLQPCAGQGRAWAGQGRAGQGRVGQPCAEPGQGRAGL